MQKIGRLLAEEKADVTVQSKQIQANRLLAAMLMAFTLAFSAQAQESAEPAPTDSPPAESQPADEPVEADAALAPVETVPVKEPQEEKTAARSDATVLDDIQVTSSKRIKSQRDLPGSVGAIRGDTLEKMSAQGMKDYIKLVPGVVYLDQGNEQSLPIIRGISTGVGVIAATGATTGIYLEDMPFSDLLRPVSIPDLNPFDLDRVEILKGPQGTLFGSGALAGAIRYLVQKPKHSVWETKLSGTYSQTHMGSPSHVTAGAINVPLFGDKLALRGVGLVRKDGGLYDESAFRNDGSEIRNVKDADKIDQQTWRALASWNVSDEFKVTGFYFDQKTRGETTGLADNPENATLADAPFGSPRDNAFGGGNLVATYDFGWGQALSSSNKMTKDNYLVVHQEYALGTESNGESEFVQVASQEIDGYTQEFRLSSPDGGDGIFEWLVGGSFLHYGVDRWEYANIGDNKPDPTEPLSETERTTAFNYGEFDGLGEELAFFGEVTGRLGEHFEITAGARQYKTTLNTNTLSCGVQVLALFMEPCHTEAFNDITSKGINPKFSVRYLHDRNIQVYLLAAKGFQFGGVQLNPAAPGFGESAEQSGFGFGPYKSSELWNYELGLRTEWLDRRLRFDLTGFYLDWKDLQTTVLAKFLMTEATFALIGNVSRAHSEGLEASLEVVPFDGATFSSSAAWISALTDAPFPQPDNTIVAPGARLPGTPHFQWANVFAYAHSLPYFSNWIGGIAFTHVHLGSAPNLVKPTGTVGGYDTLDARISLARPGWSYFPEINAGLNNLTDVRGPAGNSKAPDVTGGDPVDYNRFVTPRTAIVTLAWRF